MKPYPWPAVAVLLAMVSPATAAPLEAYGRLPSIEEVVISPDGRNLALTVTNGDQRKIVIQSVADRKMVGVINAGDQKVREVQWAGPAHLIITTSQTGGIGGTIGGVGENLLGADYALPSRSQHPLLASFTSQTDITTNVMAGLPQIRVVDGKPYALVPGFHYAGSEGRFSLFKVDLDHGSSSLQSEGLPHTRDFLVDGRGEPLAEAEYDAPSSQWLLKVWRGHWQEAGRAKVALETPELFGLGRDGASILLGLHEDNALILKEMSPTTLAFSEAVGAPEPSQLYFDPRSARFMAVMHLVGDEARYTFFDPQDAKVWKALEAAYPGSSVRLGSVSDDHQKWVIEVDSPTEGPAYALVDLATKKGIWLGDVRAGLKSGDISEVRPVAFTAGDGLPLTGYLTLPRGKAAKGLPLVVLPHGGPAARDEAGFDWWAQAYASKGYAVLQVNYRGSAGFGWTFQSRGFGQWGRKMQTDLSDGVRYLAGQGIIDPTRVCIVGGSYGGYAALAGATLQNGIYRCAVSVAGPSDLHRMIMHAAEVGGRQAVETQRYWVRYMGSDSTLGEISPALHAQAASVPILLIHGKDDTVVPFEQSQEMADALRKAGKPVEFVTLKGEDHWLSRGETRLQMLQASVDFLEKHNPPG